MERTTSTPRPGVPLYSAQLDRPLSLSVSFPADTAMVIVDAVDVSQCLGKRICTP